MVFEVFPLNHYKIIIMQSSYQRIFDIVPRPPQFLCMPSRSQPLNLSQQDTKTIPKLHAVNSHVPLLLPQVDILGYFHQQDRETNNGESPNILNNIEKSILSVVYDSLSVA